MTCIVGLEQAGRVYMGADSVSSDGHSREISVYPKLFRLHTCLIGSCGSFRVLNLLRFSFAPRAPAQGEEAFEYLVTGFVPALRACLMEHGVGKVQDQVESAEADFLVGYSGKLFSIYSDFQVDRYAHGYDAIGAGKAYALGALHAQANADAEPRLTAALSAAAFHCALVSAPFVIEKIGD